MLITLKTKFRKGFFQHLEKLKKSAIEKKKQNAIMLLMKKFREDLL